MGTPCHKPLPKSALMAGDDMPAMICVLYGSTGDVEISLFHGLSAGNTCIFSAASFVGVQAVPPPVPPPPVPPPPPELMDVTSSVFLLQEVIVKMLSEMAESKTREQNLFLIVGILSGITVQKLSQREEKEELFL